MSDDLLIPAHPFTWPTARSLGVRRSDLDEAVADGRVVRLLRGVYARAELDLTPWTRAAAARLVISEHSVVRDRTAAWIWGVDCFAYAELDGTPPIETCVLRGHEPTEREQVAGITRDLLPDDWVELDGLRVTTPVRTALDLGCSLRPHDALGAMDALMRAHNFSHGDLRVLLRRYRGRRGVVQLRWLVAEVDPRAESQPESWLRWFIVEWGLPRPEPQVWVTVAGTSYRLDLAYPRARIAVEYDGEEFHSSPEQRERDDARRAALRAAGWIVIVVSKEALAPEQRERWLTELAEALRSRRVRPRPDATRTIHDSSRTTHHSSRFTHDSARFTHDSR